MLHEWDDPESRRLGIDLVGEQILFQPTLFDFRAQEVWSRPIVVTVPRSLDPESLGRMAIAMLSFSMTAHADWREEEPDQRPEVEVEESADFDPSELPEFMGGTWVPPPPQPPTEEERAYWDAEARRRKWPHHLKERLARVVSDRHYVRSALYCDLLQSRGKLLVTPFTVTDPDHPEGIGRYNEKESILLDVNCPSAELGTAIRSALERSRNPWLPFVAMFRAAREKKPALPPHPLDLEPDWIPSNLSFIHGEAMNREQFWDLIRTTRPTPYIYGQHRDNLAGTLLELDPKGIASFEKNYLDLADELYDVRVVEVMWVLSGGGPGDEGWTLFTSWLILQGRKKFEQVLKAPEQLPVLFPQGTEIYGDGIGIDGLAREAYEESTGRDDFDEYYESIYGDYQFPAAPRGAKKDPRTEPEKALEKRLRAKYPDLWKYEGHFD